MRTKHTPRGLFYPIVISNGDQFPEFAKAFLWLDLRPYATAWNSSLPRGSRTKTEEFQSAMKKGARDLRECIGWALQCRADWMEERPTNEKPPSVSLSTLPK